MKICKRLRMLISFFAAGLLLMQCNNDDEVTLDLDQVAFENASLVNGGMMYDEFWANETNFVAPVDASINMVDVSSFSDFYRCKQCHAWDQKGRFASYIDRGPKTSRPNISSVDLATKIPNMTIKELFDEVKHTGGAPVDPVRTSDGTNASLGGDEMPDYGKILNDDQIWDLVKFLKNGTLDTEQLYDVQVTGIYPTGSRAFINVGKDGNAVTGRLFYDNNCASCHGGNGRDDGNGTIIAINQDIGLSMGAFAREKPYELQHKARFGNLGSSPTMNGVADATMGDIKNLLKALSDPSIYPDL